MLVTKTGQPSKTCLTYVNRVSLTALMSFALTAFVMAFTRIYDAATCDNADELSNFPTSIFKVTLLDSQIFILLARNSMECVRLLCSAYIAVIAQWIRFGPSRLCRKLLDNAGQSGNHHETARLVQQACLLREWSLQYASSASQVLVVVVRIILLADLVGLLVLVGELLAERDLYQRIRTAGLVPFYGTSLGILFAGMMRLTNEVRV